MKGEADAQDLILHVNGKSTKTEAARKILSDMVRSNNSKRRILAKLHAITQSGTLLGKKGTHY
jgi:hypothetical protein